MCRTQVIHAQFQDLKKHLVNAIIFLKTSLSSSQCNTFLERSLRTPPIKTLFNKVCREASIIISSKTMCNTYKLNNGARSSRAGLKL
jgi:hypothetical protein